MYVYDNSRGSNEDMSERRQQTTVVKHEYSVRESDGGFSEPVVRSARHTATKSQKTTTTVVKTTQSNRVLTNGDRSEVGEYSLFVAIGGDLSSICFVTQIITGLSLCFPTKHTDETAEVL